MYQHLPNALYDAAALLAAVVAVLDALVAVPALVDALDAALDAVTCLAFTQRRYTLTHMAKAYQHSKAKATG